MKMLALKALDATDANMNSSKYLHSRRYVPVLKCHLDKHLVVEQHFNISKAASMVAESARICGRVRFVLGVTSYLGCAWWDLELHGCYCMGACIISVLVDYILNYT